MLKRDSFVVKIAYHDAWYTGIPSQVSICRLFWQFVGNLMLLSFMWVAGSALIAFSWAAVSLIAGYRWSFNSNKTDRPQAELKKISPWPKVFGKHLWPIFVWGPIALALFVPWSTVSQFVVLHSSTIMGVVFGSLGWWLGIWLHRRRTHRTQDSNKFGSWELLKQYLKAKKSKVCPMVEIEPAEIGFEQDI